MATDSWAPLDTDQGIVWSPHAWEKHVRESDFKVTLAEQAALTEPVGQLKAICLSFFVIYIVYLKLHLYWFYVIYPCAVDFNEKTSEHIGLMSALRMV